MNNHSINQNFKTNVCPDFFPCADGSYTTRIARGACSKHGGLLSVNAKPKKTRQPKQIIPTPVVPNIPEPIEIEIPEQVEIWPTQDQEQYLDIDKINGMEIKSNRMGITEFVLYSDNVGKILAGAVLAFLTYKAIKK